MNAPRTEASPVQVRSLDKTYRNGTRANRDISLTVRRGELLGILGPNGVRVRKVALEQVDQVGSGPGPP